MQFRKANLLLGLAVVLAGCASNTTDYATGVQGWQGQSLKTLEKQWGQPDVKVLSRSGNPVYIYKTTSYRSYPTSYSPQIGVNVSGKRAVIVSDPNTNPSISRGPQSITCSALFEANPAGTIVNTQVKGSGCYLKKSYLVP